MPDDMNNTPASEIELPPELDNIDGMSGGDEPSPLPDDQGAAPPEDSPAPSDDAAPQGTPASTDAAAKDGAAPSPDGPLAPDTWTKEAKAAWGSVPPEVKSELVKRENDYKQGLAQYRVPAEVGSAFEKIITPYLPVYQKFGVNPWDHIPQLLQAHAVMTYGQPEHRIAVFQQLARDAGIDIAKLAEGGTAAYQSELAQLRQQVQALTANVSGVAGKMSASEMATLEAEVKTFASDPANEFFFDVADGIQAFLSRDPQMTLRRAYDLAVLDNPVVREKILQRQVDERSAAASKANAGKVTNARKAASVNVVSRGQGRTAPASSGDWESTLHDSLKEIRARETQH